MLYRTFFVIAAVVSLIGDVIADWTPSVEGDTDSQIKIVDTEEGFNVTDSGGNFTVLTSYKTYHCNESQRSDLSNAVVHACGLARQGFKKIQRPGTGPTDFIDFRHEIAIDYFGPPSKNHDQQGRIYTALSRASYAYRGYGWADWWYNRWVVLNCDESVVGKRCNSDTYAVTSNKNKNFGYPLITFCSPFWDEPSHIQAIQKTSQSEETKLNSLNMDSKAATMLHEWLHINWGSAEVFPGGAEDQYMAVGRPQKLTKAYGPGKSKLLARERVDKAIYNVENYVFFVISWWMKRKWGIYPPYPSAWDRNKSIDENLDREANEPGYPKDSDDRLDKGFDNGAPDPSGPVVDGPLYDVSDYPDWYRPKLTASLPTTSPVTLPSINAPPEETEPPPDAITSTVSDSPSSSSSPSPSSSSPPPSPSPPPPASDTCDVSYKFVYNAFEIRGKNFNPAKFGTNGDGLRKQIAGCGRLTDWTFEMTPTDPTYQWYASGHLPVGTKACVGRAVVSAGGSTQGNCQGGG